MHKGSIWERQREVTDGKITIQNTQRFNFRKAERRYIGGNITIQNAQRFNLRKAKRSYRWKTLQFKMHKGLIWERQREVIDKNITIQNA